MDTSTAAKQKAQQATNDVKPWIRGLARMGYGAKGVVYLVIGILAVQAAFGPGGKTTGSKGAFVTIAGKPFGEALLWLLAVGLIGFAAWKIIQAFKDPDNKGTGMKAIGSRIGYVGSGIVHIFLSYSAVKIIMRAGSSSSSEKSWSAKLLGQPFGQWVLGFVGLCFIAFGIYQVVRAYKKSFMKQLKQYEMHNQEQWWGTKVGQVGFTARGIVFGLIGVFLIQTAISADPDKTRGLDGALSELSQQPFGAFLLAIVAIGLIAYGLFMFVIAKNRRMNIS